MSLFSFAGMSREYFLILCALVGLSILAWIVAVQHMGGMGYALVTGSMTMSMPFSVTHMLLYIALWGVMMVAMMFPAIVPVAGIFATMARQRREQQLPSTPVWVFVAGYAVLWTLTGSVGYAADLTMQTLPARFPMLKTYNMLISGALLIGAGLYQLTPLKDRCLAHCRSPFAFLMAHWRDGYGGAFQMGLAHGLYCLACCWSLMMVMFIMGTMNLVWMGILSIAILLEKSLPAGTTFGRGVGTALIVLGVALSTGMLV